jgi:hypothetical protein
MAAIATNQEPTPTEDCPMPCTCLAPDIRTEARFDTTTRLDPEPTVYDVDAVHAALLRENAASDNPWPTCAKCGYMMHPNDMGWFYEPAVCCSCEMRRADKLLAKIAKRHGRKKALKLLKALTK